jgi:hypothetical protein
MIELAVGATRPFSLGPTEAGIAGQLEVRIEDADNVIVTPASGAGIVEFAAGWYRKVITGPAAPAGVYYVIWRNTTTGAEGVEEFELVSAPVPPATPAPDPGAPMTSLQWLRKLLEDEPSTEMDIAYGDGEDREFVVSNPPATSEVVRLNGVPQALNTHYVMIVRNSQPIGIRFNAAPAQDARVDIEYTRQTWGDTELATYLTGAEQNWITGSVESVYAAACYAVDTLLMGAATALNFGAGEESYDMVSVWQRLVQLRTEIWGPWLETRQDQPYLSIADMVIDVDDPDADWANLGTVMPYRGFLGGA